MDEDPQEAVALTAPVQHVPEWGDSVHVRALPPEERDELLDAPHKYGLLAARCIVDKNGERLFTDADAEALGKKSAKALERIWRAVALTSDALPMPPSYDGSAVSVDREIQRFHDDLDALRPRAPNREPACRPLARARAPRRRRAVAGTRRSQDRGDPSGSGDDDPPLELGRLPGGAR